MLSDPFPANFPLPTPSSALAFQTDLRTPYMQQWNFNVQQQLGRDRMVEVAYVGSKGTKLLGARDINQPRPARSRVNPRPVPQFADINLLESRANSIYHSLQARFQQRLHRGLTAARLLHLVEIHRRCVELLLQRGRSEFPQDSHNMRAERGLSNFDRAAPAFAELLPTIFPFGKGLLRGGWQTFGI